MTGYVFLAARCIDCGWWMSGWGCPDIITAKAIEHKTEFKHTVLGRNHQ